MASIADPSEGSHLRKSERTRLRILDAAEKIFGARGYHDASIIEITQAADVAQGTFYVHFPSKKAIFEELIRTRAHEIHGATDAAVAGLSDRREIEAAGFRAYFRWIAEHPALYRVARSSEYTDSELVREWYRAFADIYTQALARAMDAGVVPRTDPEMLAWAVMGMAESVALRFIVWNEGQPMPPETVERFIEIALRALGLD